MGFLDSLLNGLEKATQKTKQTGREIEREYMDASSRVAYMSIEDVLRSCPPPNSTLRNPGRMKAYTEKIEEWVSDNLDNPERIRDMAHMCQNRNWDYGLRMLQVVYKKYR